MSSYLRHTVLSGNQHYIFLANCKHDNSSIDRYILGNNLASVANEDYHCPVNGEGLFAYAVFSVTQECITDIATNADFKTELRMWEKSPSTVTGGNLNAIKSVKITGANSKATSPVSIFL